ncbi:MAG: hypothetical protein E6Q97_16595 [Desulfurellales bacterium]|nr:MAG: hypothetical protein E6Q97_16595 [Desulfurellales bacterium]
MSLALTIDRAAINTDLIALNSSIVQYVALSRLTPSEALARKSADLATAMSRRLRGLAPAKGAVRRERLSALKSGRGLRIRDAVRTRVMAKYGAAVDIRTRRGVYNRSLPKARGKRLSLQALMVKAELGLRESGRGFLGFSGRFKGIRSISSARSLRYSDKFRRFLTDAGLTESGDGATLTLWENVAPAALAGLSKAKAQAAIQQSLREVNADMRVYIDRKLAENAAKAGLQ